MVLKSIRIIQASYPSDKSMWMQERKKPAQTLGADQAAKALLGTFIFIKYSPPKIQFIVDSRIFVLLHKAIKKKIRMY